MRRSIIFVLDLVILLVTQALPARAQSSVAVAGSYDSRIEFFYARNGQGSGIYHIWQTAAGPAGPFLQQWDRMADVTDGPPSIAARRDTFGRVVVGWLDGGTLVVSHAPGQGTSLPAGTRLDTHDFHSLAIAGDADGRTEFFALDSAGEAWSVAQSAVGTSWATPNTHNLAGHDLRRLAPVSYQDGRLALIALGGDGIVYWKSQTGPNKDWGPWLSLNGAGGVGIQEIAAFANADGGIQVVAIDPLGNLVERRSFPNGSWAAWIAIAVGPFSAPLALEQDSDGRLEAFVRQANNASIAHIWEARENLGFIPTLHTGDITPYAGEDFAITALPSKQLAIVSESGTDCAVGASMQGVPSGGWIAAPPIPSPCPPTIKITNFNAKPNYINAGQTSTLSWTIVKNASCSGPSDKMVSSADGGPPVTEFSDGDPSGEYVKPTLTSVYTLTATCIGTSSHDTSQTSVGVAPAVPQLANVKISDGPFYNPPFPDANVLFTATITIKNYGNLVSTPMTGQFYLDQSPNGDPWSIPALAPGQQTSETTKFQTGLAPGTYDMKWIILDNNSTNDSNLTVN